MLSLFSLAFALLVTISFAGCASSPPPSQHDSGLGSAKPGDDDDLDGEGDDDLDVGTMQSPPKNRYEVVVRGFDQSTLMPLTSDFDSIDDPSPRLNCLSVKITAPNVMSEMVIRQMMVPVNGTIDYGPLFPGAPEHAEPRLVIGRNNGWVNSQNLTPEMRQVFELGRAPGALVIRINENKFGIYQDIGAPAEIWIRKSLQGQLFFKVYKLNADHSRNEVFIGYCFDRGGPRLAPKAN